MASTSSCTIGIKSESICHKTTDSQEIGLINFDVLCVCMHLFLHHKKCLKYKCEEWQPLETT